MASLTNGAGKTGYLHAEEGSHCVWKSVCLHVKEPNRSTALSDGCQLLLSTTCFAFFLMHSSCVNKSNVLSVSGLQNRIGDPVHL